MSTPTTSPAVPKTAYTSRSAVECYRECNRERYLRYHHNGTGMVPTPLSIPLSTGTSIHAAVAHMLFCLQATGSVPPDVLEVAIVEALRKYDQHVQSYGLLVETKEQDWVYQEQRAVIEALCRLWYYRELPRIAQRFKVLVVELETSAILPVTGPAQIVYEGTPDSLFQDQSTGDVLVYSLKSVKEWSHRTEKSYKHDSQVISEFWLAQEWVARQNEAISHAQESLGSVSSCSRLEKDERNLQAVAKYLDGLRLQGVMGVTFCFLIKGRREERTTTDGNIQHYTDNPFTRAYRKFSPTSVDYAHSYWFPKPENESGKGRLGKGWEPFYVWEEVGGISGWMKRCNTGSIQPECGDVLSSRCITPPEVFVRADQVMEYINEISATEAQILYALGQLEEQAPDDPRALLATLFPKNRRSCHWPVDCDYLPVCHLGVPLDEMRETYQLPKGEWYKGEVSYRPRQPHHTQEAESM